MTGSAGQQPDGVRAHAAIDVRDLHKSFGSNEVLRGIDFHVSPREVVCVIGPSGSGKSTLLRCINLLETPTSGHVFVSGIDVTDPESYPNGDFARLHDPEGNPIELWQSKDPE